jgi:DNA-binding MarR family transcriptional regulator
MVSTIYFTQSLIKLNLFRYTAGMTSKAELARDAWRLMFDFLIRSSAQRNRSLGRRGLTPNDSRALTSLTAQEGRSMSALAEAWGCDASNATWIVDRLEKLGLAERKNVAHDRRVKLVMLTAKGQKTKAELHAEFYAPPGELLALDRATLASLCAALSKIVQEPDA